MLKKLRVKFILVSMLAIALVLVCVLGAVNLKSYIAIKDDADELLDLLFENNGRFPTMPNEPMKKDDRPHRENDKRPIDLSPETPFNTRYFAVLLDTLGDVRAMNIDSIAAVDDERAAELAQKVAKGGKERGFVGSYRYLSRQTPDGGSVCLFLDTTEDLDNFKDFLFASLTLSILGLLVVALLVVIFSGIVMAPFAELYKKQKRFITDASHELKTPLTVISADCDILEYKFGKNEWTDAIGAQVLRLAGLTDKLVLLSRMDEGGGGRVLMTEFSLSEVVEEVASTYQSVCEAAGKRLCVSASPALSVVGDQSLIKNVLTLLLDNAVKYSSEGSEISLSLRSVGRSKRITVSNKVDRLPEGDLSLLFERFYRPDSSRSSESGGHGIGLSVVQSIVRLHGGKISVCAPDKNTVVFTVIL